MIQNVLLGVVNLLILDFLVDSLSQQKLATKNTHFTIQVCSKNTDRFTKLNSLSIMKTILPKHSRKKFTLQLYSKLTWKTKICMYVYVYTYIYIYIYIIYIYICIYVYIYICIYIYNVYTCIYIYIYIYIPVNLC